MKPEEILIVVPSRGRPAAIDELADAWRATDARATLCIAVDDDDERIEEYRDAYYDISDDGGVDIALRTAPRPPNRLAGVINGAAAGEIARNYAAIGFMGDDHRPRTPRWDARFAECLSAGAGIVYGNDLLVGSKFPTAVVMTSDIPQAVGYMCPDGFTHLCLDLVWLDWGKGMERITYLDDVIIEHMHPAAGKAQLDAGYEYANSQQMVTADSAAYFDYRDNGRLAADIEKLRTLL